MRLRSLADFSIQIFCFAKTSLNRNVKQLSLKFYFCKKESSQPFDFDDKTDYIGKLKPERTGEALLKFTVKKDASPKTYLLDIEIRSIDGDEVITQDKTIKIQVVDEKKKTLLNSLNPVISTVIVLLIVLLGLIIFKFYKK